MKNRHKHADIIIAWAEGAEIEVCSDKSGIWTSTMKPTWNIDCQYRVKSQPEYVPYELEDYKEASILVGRTAESKTGESKILITNVSRIGGTIWINGLVADIMFEKYILCDGNPIGKLI